MNGGWEQALLLSGLPLLLLGVAAAGSFLKPAAKAWIERFIFLPGLWVIGLGGLAYGFAHHSRVGEVLAAGLILILSLRMIWRRFGPAQAVSISSKPLADTVSGTGTRP